MVVAMVNVIYSVSGGFCWVVLAPLTVPLQVFKYCQLSNYNFQLQIYRIISENCTEGEIEKKINLRKILFLHDFSHAL